MTDAIGATSSPLTSNAPESSPGPLFPIPPTENRTGSKKKKKRTGNYAPQSENLKRYWEQRRAAKSETPRPATVSESEAKTANAQRDQARAQVSKQPQPESGRPPKTTGLTDRKTADGRPIYVIPTRSVCYVDQGGIEIPGFEAKDLRPTFEFVSILLQKARKWDPLNEQEIDSLSSSWAPVCTKYMPYVLGFMPEISAAIVSVTVLWPRVTKELERGRVAGLPEARLSAPVSPLEAVHSGNHIVRHQEARSHA